MSKLTSYVHVQDDQGANHVFGPDDSVPGWAKKKITNPKAWDKAPAKSEEPDPNAAPPRAGAGSGKEAWVAFAAKHDVQLSDDATREDYIAELERRGVIEPKE